MTNFLIYGLIGVLLFSVSATLQQNKVKTHSLIEVMGGAFVASVLWLPILVYLLIQNIFLKERY